MLKPPLPVAFGHPDNKLSGPPNLLTASCHGRLLSLLLLAVLGCFPFGRAHAAEPPLIGMLQSDPAHIAATNDAGARGVVVGVSWDRGEPRDGEFDLAYLKTVRDRIDTFRAGGKKVVLDLGVQYPPDWIFGHPEAHFVNQDGKPFQSAPASGECGVNLVFSQAMRDRFEAYLKLVFAALGKDFEAVRLGGGRYGEVGYPINVHAGNTNCYWAFDPIAQGRQPGLPPGMKPCPVPGWIPGTASPKHDSARQFLDWYMESLRNYHDWQIAVARRFYPGTLHMLYPSIGGLRPGQLEAAIADDANGSTGAERTGEVGRGYDMARFIAGITDSQVMVYCTWIDGFDGSDDASPDPGRWSPAHFLASLAAVHQPPLAVGGENTGHPDDLANLKLTFERMRTYHLSALFWAFEPTLFDGKDGHSTIADFKACAGQDKPLR